jgi:plasmid maintenance system antidote protein VapI
MDSITRQNCKVLLAAFIEENELSVQEIANVISCSEASISRILAGESLPTDNMLVEVGILIEIGFERYSNLSKSEKKKLLEAMGAAGGGAIGFSAITAAVSTLGAVSGLSAAGVTTGLGALGAIVGGSMVAGISVAAAIPIAVGAAGYGIIKAAKSISKKYKMDQGKFDHMWEMPLENEMETQLDNEKMDQIIMGNDEFILFIRKSFPDCSKTTDQLGKRIWSWLRYADPGSEIIVKGLPCYWGDKGDFISANRLPKTATQFKFGINVLPDLYEYLSELGSVST